MDNLIRVFKQGFGGIKTGRPGTDNRNAHVFLSRQARHATNASTFSRLQNPLGKLSAFLPRAIEISVLGDNAQHVYFVIPAQAGIQLE
jgi:hypothetical protein